MGQELDMFLKITASLVKLLKITLKFLVQEEGLFCYLRVFALENRCLRLNLRYCLYEKLLLSFIQPLDLAFHSGSSGVTPGPV